ncbi:MAG: hypothetical protein ABL921_35070, partial [Pirellula sp.]
SFDNTGRFNFAPATGELGSPLDDDAFQKGFQGTLRISFQSGTNTSDQALHTMHVFVTPGYSASVPALIEEGTSGRILGIMRMQQRLNYLGYVDVNGNPLVVDGIVGPLTRSSAGLFNAVISNSQTVAEAPWVDADQINRSSAPRWLELPNSGPHWSLSGSALADNRDWTSSWSADLLNVAGSSLPNGNTMSVTLASETTGGAIPGVVGHVTGRDLDIGSYSSIYRTRTVNSVEYVAARTVSDPTGVNHVARSISGSGNSFGTTLDRLTLFTSGQTPANLAQVQTHSGPSSDADAWLRVSMGNDRYELRRIVSVGPGAGQIKLDRALPASLASSTSIAWAIFHTVPLSSASTSSGLVADVPFNITNRGLLTGLAPLLADPASGYSSTKTLQQIQALRRAHPESAAKAIAIEFNDPRLWGLPGTISENEAAGYASYSPDAASALQLRSGPGASIESALSSIEMLGRTPFPVGLNGFLKTLPNLPLVADNPASTIDFLTPLQAFISNVSLPTQVTSLQNIATGLTQSGYTVDYVKPASEVASFDTNVPTDLLSFYRQVTLSQLMADTTFDAGILQSILELADVAFTGNLSLTSNVTLTLHYGIDQFGLYLDGTKQLGTANYLV